MKKITIFKPTSSPTWKLKKKLFSILSNGEITLSFPREDFPILEKATFCKLKTFKISSIKI